MSVASGRPPQEVLSSALATAASTPDIIRNFCLIAHVDHGKTSLTDHLIASNGVVSSAIAGTVRYMDSRADEQEKQITLKVSAITITHKGNIFTLLDSPGHVDFSSEVSCGLTVGDGALLIVDVVEGPTPQTALLVRQAIARGVKLALVLNKMDRVFAELSLGPLEAYERCRAVIAASNAVVAGAVAMICGAEAQARGDDAAVLPTEDFDEYFSPEKGNVAFSSASDGWAFRLSDFAALHAAKLGVPAGYLSQHMWGEWYLRRKDGKADFSENAPRPGAEPAAVGLVLAPLAKAYGEMKEAAEQDDKAALASLVERMGLAAKVPSRSIAFPKNFQAVTRAILGAYLPISNALLDLVCTSLPAPSAACVTQRWRLQADPTGPPVAIIAKLLDAEVTLACDGPDDGATETVDDILCRRDGLIGFVRVVSGTLKAGSKVYLLSPAYCPSIRAPGTYSTVTVERLRIFWSRGPTAVEEVPAGMICGLCGVATYIKGWRTATIAPSLDYSPIIPPGPGGVASAEAVVRLSITPRHPADMDRLKASLDMLATADSQVTISVDNCGRFVLSAGGEVHANRCIRDISTRYATLELDVSEPLVEYRETVVWSDRDIDTMKASDASVLHPNSEGALEISDSDSVFSGSAARASASAASHGAEGTASSESIKALGSFIRPRKVTKGRRLTPSVGATPGPGHFALRVLAVPLPSRITEAATQHRREISTYLSDRCGRVDSDRPEAVRLYHTLKHAFAECGEWDRVLPSLWAVGHDCFLFNSLKAEDLRGWWQPYVLASEDSAEEATRTAAPDDRWTAALRFVSASLCGGFVLASSAGPYCGEPMQGVAFFVDSIYLSDAVLDKDPSVITVLPGQILSCSADVFRAAVGGGETTSSAPHLSRRICEPMLQCVISTDQTSVGKVYNVLSKRRADILDEDMVPLTTVFVITVQLPAAESFGLASELRAVSSGAASPSPAYFVAYKQLQMDPFWTPVTAEEVEEFGVDGRGVSNYARDIVQLVRKRKGLFVAQQAVERPEAQKFSRRGA